MCGTRSRGRSDRRWARESLAQPARAWISPSAFSAQLDLAALGSARATLRGIISLVYKTLTLRMHLHSLHRSTESIAQLTSATLQYHTHTDLQGGLPLQSPCAVFCDDARSVWLAVTSSRCSPLAALHSSHRVASSIAAAPAQTLDPTILDHPRPPTAPAPPPSPSTRPPTPQQPCHCAHSPPPPAAPPPPPPRAPPATPATPPP